MIPPHFCQNTDKKSGNFKVAKRNNPNDFLTKEQAEFVYKRVNAGKGINIHKIKQGIVQTKLLEESEPDNNYQKAI